MRARGERRSFDTGARKRSLQFLPPMRHIAGRPVAINHRHRRVAGVRQLMKHPWRNIDRLAGFHGALFFSEAHLSGAFGDKVDFLLFLVMPRHLPAARLQRYVAKRKMRALNRTSAAYQVLRLSARRISAPRDLFQIRDNQSVFSF